jgi:hypothetical protein
MVFGYLLSFASKINIPMAPWPVPALWSVMVLKGYPQEELGIICDPLWQKEALGVKS